MIAAPMQTNEEYVIGLTDFGPGRSKLFANSANENLKVHQRGPTQADVTEGSGAIWERLRYDPVRTIFSGERNREVLSFIYLSVRRARESSLLIPRHKRLTL